MKDFQHYLDNVGEIGYVVQNVHSIVYVSGLPGAHPNEVVIFENKDTGLILSLGREFLEVLVFSNTEVRVGSRVVRTGESVTIGVGEGLLGRMIDPLGAPLDKKGEIKDLTQSLVDISPPKIVERRNIEEPLMTGVAIVDLISPLGKGQRELVIGDRKTGKTELLLQTMSTQAKLGTVCIYSVIGQKQIDISKLYEFFTSKGIIQNTILLVSSSSDSSGLIYLTPYSAMTIAEYFRDKGMDVLLVLDDMTTHARNYREISLLARKFPGRSSYPGDIFYIHSRLVERAGSFKKGSITCLPVAESILGDLSGYIQTNLMSMTDGHIFFDIELVSQGKRPAVNPFLSVTRVGHQTQTPLQKDVSRELSVFLVTYDRMKQFMHFGAEVGDTAKNILNLGARVDAFFNQPGTDIVSININTLIIAGLWAGIWSEVKIDQFKMEMEQLTLLYSTDDAYKKEVDTFIESSKIFSDIVTGLRRDNNMIVSKIKRGSVS
jgi:F-type H+/Na+-transporting ATPase subunit alpha